MTVTIQETQTPPQEQLTSLNPDFSAFVPEEYPQRSVTPGATGHETSVGERAMVDAPVVGGIATAGAVVTLQTDPRDKLRRIADTPRHPNAGVAAAVLRKYEA